MILFGSWLIPSHKWQEERRPEVNALDPARTTDPCPCPMYPVQASVPLDHVPPTSSKQIHYTEPVGWGKVHYMPPLPGNVFLHT